MEPKCPEYSLVVVNPMECVQWVDKCDVFTIDIVVGFPNEDVGQVVSQRSHRRPKIEVKIRPLRVPAALAPVLGRRGLGRRDGGLLRGAEQEQETEVARGCGLRRAGPGAVDLAAAVAWQDELGLEEGARGQLAGRRGELGKEERHGFLLLALQFFWSPLLRLRASVSHGEASKSQGLPPWELAFVYVVKRRGVLRRFPTGEIADAAPRAGRLSSHVQRKGNAWPGQSPCRVAARPARTGGAAKQEGMDGGGDSLAAAELVEIQTRR